MNAATTASGRTIAETILTQLGGSRFLTMTGARDLMGGADSLNFKLPRGAKDGINAVRIVLDATDTYTVTFFKIGRLHKSTTVRETAGVQVDGLRALFTDATGLHTSLGTMVAHLARDMVAR